MQYFIRNRFCWLLVLIFILSVSAIYILHFTDYRPFSCVNAQEANKVIENVSYGIITSTIFYIITVIIPSVRNYGLKVEYIKGKLFDLTNKFMQIEYLVTYDFFEIIHPDYSMDILNSNFSKCDFSELNFNKTERRLDSFNKYRIEIVEISNELMNSYVNEMTKSELEFLKKLMQSEFVRIGLTPMDFQLEDELRSSYPNNQDIIADEICNLYTMVKSLCK